MVTGLQSSGAVNMGCRDDKWQSVWHQICLLIWTGKQRSRLENSWDEWRQGAYLSIRLRVRVFVCLCVFTQRVSNTEFTENQTPDVEPTLTLSGAWLWRLPTSSGVMRGTFWKPSSTLAALAPLSWRLLPSFTIFRRPCISPLFLQRLLLDGGGCFYSWLCLRVDTKPAGGGERGVDWTEILTLLHKTTSQLVYTHKTVNVN